MLGENRRLAVLITVFLCLVLYFVSTFRMGVVRGASMEPTYVDGQSVLVRRLNRLGRPLKRGDVVLVRNDHEVIIKRVFRLPGEEVDHSFPDVLASTLYRDLTDFYDQKQVSGPDGTQTHYYVPQDYIVVVGDNIPVSEDSRVFGPISLRDVLGAVVNAPGAPYNQQAQGSTQTPANSRRRHMPPPESDPQGRLDPYSR